MTCKVLWLKGVGALQSRADFISKSGRASLDIVSFAENQEKSQ